MRITRGIVVTVAVAALSLTGCTTDNESPEAPEQSAPSAQTPTKMWHSEPLSSCTVQLSGESNIDINQIELNCGGGDNAIEETLDGDFRDGVRNNYGEESIVDYAMRSGNETHVMLKNDDGRCLIRYEVGSKPVECKHFSDNQE